MEMSLSNPPTIMFSPNRNWYAVIRMDPVAMVQDLDDPEATAAAKAMAPQKYLIYINEELELPWPNRPWYPYTISALGPSLREEEKEKGIVPEMCIPVYPNVSHPTGREPLRPITPFPYSNCYHWLHAKTDIRVLARPSEHFDIRRAIQLPPREELRMGRCWTEDIRRIRETAAAMAEAAKEAATSKEAEAEAGAEADVLVEAGALAPMPATPYHATKPTNSTPAIREEPVPICENAATSTSNIRYEEHSARHSSSASLSDSCNSRSFVSEESDINSVEAIMRMDIFSAPDQDLTLLPLFELWEEVGAHLKEEDIPNPMGLFRERDEIKRIIQDARVRAYAALTAQAPASAPRKKRTTKAPASRTDRGADATRDSPQRSRHLRPLKVWRKLRSHVKAFSVVVSSRINLPYIPVWP